MFGGELTPQAMAGFLSATIAAIAALLVFLQWRERHLRQDDVLKWANEAIRVQVKLGRRSVQFVEVIEGLAEGDRVILSDMTQYEDHNRLRLN